MWRLTAYWRQRQLAGEPAGELLVSDPPAEVVQQLGPEGLPGRADEVPRPHDATTLSIFRDPLSNVRSFDVGIKGARRAARRGE